ncbi:MAG: hypothetical protein J5I93_28860 [Pirellulaceae bacterium]|nr:hypothetical protein [Pirellulaceae bacterium]
MLNSNFKDMLSALNAAGAEYLLIGAYAMAVHGCPRATGDIDIWVRPTPANAARVWQALRRFGAPLSRMRETDFHTPDNVYQIGLPPQRIDILTSVSGVDFDAAWAERLQIEVEDQTVTVIGLRQLYQNKLACGRDKDMLDAKILKRLLD